jgi:aryl-alcohol dehydrogenase-like predicted oxidoreductase
VERIVGHLRRIGEAHGGKTPSQVALAWLIAKGSVPIPGAKNREQAEQNTGALGWSMTAEEIATLDAAALGGKRGIAQRVWQHG